MTVRRPHAAQADWWLTAPYLSSTISVNISSNEWMRIYEAARAQWPGELLSRSEILRRYIVIGIGKLKNVAPSDQERMAHQLRVSMATGDERLRS